MKVRTTFFSTFRKLDLPLINTKLSTSEIVNWKNSQQVKNVLLKLNQNIFGYENLTWYTRIIEKIWEKVEKVSKEKITFTFSILQYLLNSYIESIKIDDNAI